MAVDRRNLKTNASVPRSDLEKAKAMLTGKLLEGLDSGKAIAFTDGYFEAKKRKLIERGGKLKGE